MFNQPKFKFAFLFLDLAIFLGSILSATFLAEIDESSRQELFRNILSFSLEFSAVFIITPVIVFYYNGLYKRNNIVHIYRQSILIIKSLVFIFIISSSLLFLFHNLGLVFFSASEVLAAFFIISFVLEFLLRVIIARAIFIFLLKKSILRSRILIFGSGETAQTVADKLTSSELSEFEIAGFVDDYIPRGEHIWKDHSCLGGLKDILSITEQTHCDEILIAIHNIGYTRLLTIIQECLSTGKVVRIYSDFFNIIAEKLNVELYAGIPVVMFSSKKTSSVTLFIKRSVDILLSSFAIILLLPLFAFVALGIKISSKGPVIFRQKRYGKNGKQFDFYKFRSMHVGGDPTQHKEFIKDYIQNKTASGEQPMRIFKITNDPRIFPFGSFIRKTSIDEFPQFFNVLKGDMSLIGPRPCLRYEWELYSDWHKHRLNVLPGCTGIWQVLGRSTVSFEEMVIMDLYYISNLSLWLDLKIILQTFPVIFLGKGAH